MWYRCGEKGRDCNRNLQIFRIQDVVERHRKCTGCGRDVDSAQDVEERQRECIICGREV